MYQWDHDMEVALQIAMGYLERTGQTKSFQDPQARVARAIAMERQAGMRHRIKLANAAIKAVEREMGSRAWLTMEYQGIRYNIIQGIERHVWRWSVTMEGILATGQAETRSDAIAAAERAIDRLKAKKVRVVPPEKPSNGTDDRSP